jgi:uncharacterized membrane protein YgcG
VDTSIIVIIIIAFIGPLLVYLTRYADKGRTAAASRLWFVSVCAYVVYYLLASGNVLEAKIEPYYFALLWPIPAILTLWLVDKIVAAESPIPYYKWLIYFVVGVVFAFVVDMASSVTGWYAYNSTITTAASYGRPNRKCERRGRGVTTGARSGARSSGSRGTTSRSTRR